MNESNKVFSVPYAWSGGSFQLGMVYRADTSAGTIRKAIEEIWSDEDVEGCYEDLAVEPQNQERVNPLASNFEPEDLARGVAILPNGKRVCCLSMVIKDDDAVWINFSLTLGSLQTAYPVGAYPFEDSLPLDWTVPVSRWLANIGERVFRKIPFEVAFIGWLDTADTELADFKAKGIPAERWYGYLTPAGGKLIWTPANMGYPMRPEKK